MAKFNGHKNWNHWNVSLWINNDEGLYHKAYSLARRYKRDRAAQIMLDALLGAGIDRTPDGAPYTYSSVRAAMVGIL